MREFITDQETLRNVADKIYKKYLTKFGDDAIFEYVLVEDYIEFVYPIYWDGYPDTYEDIEKQIDFLRKEMKNHKDIKIFVGDYVNF